MITPKATLEVAPPPAISSGSKLVLSFVAIYGLMVLVLRIFGGGLAG